MVKKNRIRGLMVGITIGFAFWGRVQAVPKTLEAISPRNPHRVSAFTEPEGPYREIVYTEGEERAKEEGRDAKDEEKVSLHSLSAVLMDGDTGRILYEKDGQVFRSMASTTKIMTCILALENGNPQDICTVSETAAAQPKVRLGARKDTQFYLKDLLYSLMLESHNDSAVALAEYVGRKYLPRELQEKDTAEYTVEESNRAVAAFAGMMNEKAKELGCENTWFITPNGLDATESFALDDGSTVQREHGTTAAELARIMSYCIKESPAREEFLEITRTRSYSFSCNGRGYSCNNHNAFLDMMSGALTGKTGFTNKAGYCYVGALERDGRTFVVTLLACGWPNNKTYKWSDTKQLMQYGIDNYFYRSFSEEGTAYDEGQLKALPVRGGQTDILGETAYMQIGIAERAASAMPRDETSYAVSREETADKPHETWKEGLLLRADEKIRVECRVADELKAPVKKGTEVGYIEYLVDDIVYKRESIVTMSDLAAVDLEWCARQVLRRFLP